MKTIKCQKCKKIINVDNEGLQYELDMEDRATQQLAKLGIQNYTKHKCI